MRALVEAGPRFSTPKRVIVRMSDGEVRSEPPDLVERTQESPAPDPPTEDLALRF